MLFGAKKIKCNVKYKDQKYIYELDRHNTIKDIYNLFSKEKSAPDDVSLLTIRLCSNKLPFNENNYETPLISLEKDKYNELCFEITKPYNCLECKKIISKYCLVCNKYYCPQCKKSEHDKHDFVDIDPTDFKESIYLWNININANLSNDITQFNKLKDFIQDNALLTKIQLWKENVIKKINTFEKFIKEICDICNKIGSNYIIKKNEVLNKLMHDLSKAEQNINKELSIGQKNASNNNKYFSFDEAEILIQKLKKIHNDIKSKNTDIKDLSEIENISSLNDIMGKISTQIDDLSKNGLNIFDSFKNFFSKYDNLNDSSTNASYPHYEICSNALSNSENHNKIYYIMKKGENLKSKMYNLGNKNNLSIALKETTLYSKDSYNSYNKTNARTNNNKRIFNSFNKANSRHLKMQGKNLYSELNLSRIKFKNDSDENEIPLYSDRNQNYPSLNRHDKIGILPLITKI